MTVYVGGMRARLIFDSTRATLLNSLTSLGWFAAGRKHQPIVFVAEEQNPEVEVAPNTLALFDEHQSSTNLELGSNLTEKTWTFYVDFFAESDVLGRQVTHDIIDILEGRMASIGRVAPVVDVYDYSMATPPHIFTIQVENVHGDRSHMFTHLWLRHWYSVQFQLVDSYEDQDG